jgi:hypothetical protein
VQVVEKTLPGESGWLSLETVSPPTPASNTVYDAAAGSAIYRVRALRP